MQKLNNKVTTTIKPISEAVFCNAICSPSCLRININFALKVSLTGPHTAEHIVTKNVVANIQTSLSMLTPKYFAENINVTTDIDIRKIRRIKRIEVIFLILEKLFIVILNLIEP